MPLSPFPLPVKAQDIKLSCIWILKEPLQNSGFKHFFLRKNHWTLYFTLFNFREACIIMNKSIFSVSHKVRVMSSGFYCFGLLPIIHPLEVWFPSFHCLEIYAKACLGLTVSLLWIYWSYRQTYFGLIWSWISRYKSYSGK